MIFTSPIAQNRLHVAGLVFLCAVPVALLISKTLLEVAILMISILFLLRSTALKDWSWTKETDILLLLLALVVMNLLVSPFAQDIERSYSRSIGWTRFVLFYAAVTRWILVDQKAISRFVTCLMIVLGLTAMDTIYQIITGVSFTGQPMSSSRLTGPLEKPNIGMYLAKLGFGASGLIVALAYRSSSSQLEKGHLKRPWMYGLACCVAVMSLTVIILSGERTANVLTLISLTLLLFGLFLKGGKARALAIGLTILGGAGIAAVLTTSDRIWGRVEALAQVVSNFTGSVYGEVMGIGLRMFADFPITGAGMGNFPQLCKNYQLSEAIRATIPSSNPECYRHPHNVYIEWFVDTGIICTALFCSFVGLLLLRSLKALFCMRDICVLASLVLGILVLSYFPIAATQSAFSNWPAALTWISVAMGVTALRFGGGFRETSK